MYAYVYAMYMHAYMRCICMQCDVYACMYAYVPMPHVCSVQAVLLLMPAADCD